MSLFALGLAGLVCATSASTAPSVSFLIVIEQDAVYPVENVFILQGDGLLWYNHTAGSATLTLRFDPPLKDGADATVPFTEIARGASWAHTFQHAGRVRFTVQGLETLVSGYIFIQPRNASP